MENKENQNVTTSRERYMNRLSQRFPDRQFKGQDGQDVQDVIDDSLDEMLSEYETGRDEYRNNSKRLNDLFRGNPKIGGLFMKWAAGGDILESLIEEFGDEFLDALSSEEGKQKYLDAQKAWLDKVNRTKEADEEARINFEKSVETLRAFQQEHNLSDDEAIAVFDKVQKIGTDMVQGIYTSDSFLLVLNAINHDSDVAAARAEGEVAGKNTRIRERMHSGDSMGNLPPSLSGQGASAGEKKPKSRRRTALDMFGLNE